MWSRYLEVFAWSDESSTERDSTILFSRWPSTRKKEEDLYVDGVLHHTLQIFNMSLCLRYTGYPVQIVRSNIVRFVFLSGYILIIVVPVLIALLLFGCGCCICKCCRKKSLHWKKEEERITQRRKERQQKADDKKDERKKKADALRMKYGLLKEDDDDDDEAPLVWIQWNERAKTRKYLGTGILAHNSNIHCCNLLLAWILWKRERKVILVYIYFFFIFPRILFRRNSMFLRFRIFTVVRYDNYISLKRTAKSLLWFLVT